MKLRVAKKNEVPRHISNEVIHFNALMHVDQAITTRRSKQADTIGKGEVLTSDVPT